MMSVRSDLSMVPQIALKYHSRNKVGGKHARHADNRAGPTFDFKG